MRKLAILSARPKLNLNVWFSSRFVVSFYEMFSHKVGLWRQSPFGGI